MADLAFAVPALAAAAPLAGAAAALLARRGLPARRTGASWTAAIARGAAVTCALLAAAQPHHVTGTSAPGVTLVASSAQDLVVARASRPADAPAVASLAWDAADPAPLPARDAAALAPSSSVDTFVTAPPATRAPLTAPSAPVRIVVPAGIAHGVPFRLFLDAGGARLPTGAAHVTVDVREEIVRLPEGATRVATPPFELSSGRHLVTARLPDGSADARWIDVAEPPRVLVVSADGTEPPLTRRLRAHGFTVETVSAASADLADPADVVVLGPGTAGGAARTASTRVLTGTGLLVFGGSAIDGRGLARLRGSPLEALLPVVLPEPPPAPEPDDTPEPAPPEDPPDDTPPSPEPSKPVLDDGDRQALRVALLLVVDRSGSMTGLPLHMACESALAAARALSPEDRVGVLSFDDGWNWIAPFQDATELAALKRRLDALRPGGGTNFFPALKEAYRVIAAQPCGIRHIVLVSDGHSSPGVYRDLVESGARAGITLSTLAIGEGAGEDELGRLATWGRGRLYPATDPQHLPQVITQDAKRFAIASRDERRKALEDIAAPPERTPTDAPRPQPPPTGKGEPAALLLRAPRVAFDAPFLEGIRKDAFPGLPHGERVTTRGAVSVPLTWDDGSPAMVLARAGEGRVAVVAADAFSADAAAFWAWDDAGPLTAQLVRALAEPRATAEPLAVRVLRMEGGAVLVTVEDARPGSLELRGTGSGPALVVSCEAHGGIATGSAGGPLPAGDVLFATWKPAGGEQVAAVTSPDRAVTRTSADIAARLAARAPARIVPTLPAPRPGPLRERRSPADLAFLAAAAGLLVVEAAARRGAHR